MSPTVTFLTPLERSAAFGRFASRPCRFVPGRGFESALKGTRKRRRESRGSPIGASFPDAIQEEAKGFLSFCSVACTLKFATLKGNETVGSTSKTSRPFFFSFDNLSPSKTTNQYYKIQNYLRTLFIASVLLYFSQNILANSIIGLVRWTSCRRDHSPSMSGQ